MLWFASMVVIGLVVAGLISSFTGSSLRPLWIGVLGVVGGIGGGLRAAETCGATRWRKSGRT